jgi:hypothetical protein
MAEDVFLVRWAKSQLRCHGRVVDYVLKTVLNGGLSYDEAVLVLPRSRGGLDTG